MYRKELNDRSPMRVFEKSMHGGLGRGNVGLVAARAGVGKTALLVQIALDDLLRDRKVLHISYEHAVDHVRSYYDELFHDLATERGLEQPEAVKLDIERKRQIYSHAGHRHAQPPSIRGGNTSVTRILESVAFARDVAHFEPDVIVVDGFDLESASADALTALRDLARDASCEIWVSHKTDRAAAAAAAPAEMPATFRRFYEVVDVIVLLQPERNVVRLRLLKDHDNKELADLHLRLDPHTMRIVDEDLPPRSDRPKNRQRFRLISGGARGAEAEFGACAERWGIAEVNYTFAGHRFLERRRGVVLLGEAELSKGDFSLVYVSKRLGRVLSDIPLIRSVLQTIWHQVSAASQVFVVGSIQADGTVRGGTGWGAELARLWKKPLFVFDQDRASWFRWSGKAWELAEAPTIDSEAFAGLGTQHLTQEGRDAIHELFRRSFGDPPQTS